MTSALAAPQAVVIEDESDWPAERRGALGRAVGKCFTEHPWTGRMYVRLAGDDGAHTAEVFTDIFPEIAAIPCVARALDADPEVRLADGWWSATVRVDADPALLAGITLTDPPKELADALRLRIATCAAGKPFHGSLVVEIAKDADQVHYQYAWPTPVTPAGDAIGQCVRGWTDGTLAAPAKVVVHIRTPTAPARAAIAFQPHSDVPAAFAAVVKDAAAQCVAAFPLKKPFDVSLSRTNGQVGAATMSMKDGQDQPSSELGQCVTFGHYPELPEGGGGSFEIGPAPK